MDNEIKKIKEQFGRRTILLPEESDSDCYAIYSKDEYDNPDERLLVDGKGYKHRLYLYKKISDKDKILTFVILNPGCANHKTQDETIDNFLKIAKEKYGAIEVFSIFTLRTLDKIDSVSEDAILDVVRADLSKNDIVLAYGDDIKPTEKYKNISDDDLEKINKVREIKINTLLDFLLKDKASDRKIFTLNNNSLDEIKRK